MIPPVANRFVAGETAAEAIEYARRLDEDDLEPMLNLLGSHHRERSSVRADAAAYRALVDDLGTLEGDAAISVKPTQLGLDVDESLFRTTLAGIVSRADDRDVFVWLDMEEHGTVEPTLAAAIDLADEYGAVGVCLQADLYRTLEDLERVAGTAASVRLVKGGAYARPEAIAHTDDARMDEAYRRLLEAAFKRVDDGLAVATHDPAMIGHARELARRHDTDFEIQMLMGVRPDAQRRLARKHDVAQFVPYGDRWKRWVINRGKRNVGFAARAVGETVLPGGRVS
ncbi:proline dehydrogenase family protein [Natrarchaeobius chitinivorans]|uniref:Proline dehydrogenase n=1 Tax=Natrarchaeobius chitinivorans TaxID=1679083 RepID=A0A3N6M3Y9_NATCH|nr:proline dehydrogenase family protein [Natrarchaeobius chitinivorans]RQG96677.1 proline dehydrogenase [Natrarchaeobius chitinivorans]